MDEIDARILRSIFHLLYAMLALDSVTCNTKNSMSVTPVNAHVVHAVIVRAGVGIRHNFRMVWHVNITDFPRIFTNSAGNTQTFHLGMHARLWH